MSAIGNDAEGILVTDGSVDNLIGGTLFGTGNLISGNGGDRIKIDWAAANNVIQGNRIGTDVTGFEALGNLGSGVLLADAFDNTIGGTTPGAENVIAHNLAEGAKVTSASDGNSITGNAIHGNGLLGIELGASDGVTANDTQDLDVGPNGLQNYPELSSAAATPGDVTVGGTLHSAPRESFRVEFFASQACDASGHGQGGRFLGFVDAMTNGAGNATIGVVLTAGVSDGEAVVATATAANGSTSEFSACTFAACSSLAPMPEPVIASATGDLVWTTPTDVSWVKGDLGQVGGYATTDGGLLNDATLLAISADQPAADDGLYYLVRPVACGSWQTTSGAEPGRDGSLP
jgi:hypothetical protein